MYNKLINKYLYILLSLQYLFVGFCNSLCAQPDNRPSEKEANLQKIFIDANREKILGRYEDAAVLFKEVLAQDARNDVALYELARMYTVLEKNEHALMSIEQALAIAPTNIWYRITQAEILKNARREKDAALVYEKLTKDFPDNDFYHYEWASLLAKTSQTAAAVKAYENIEKKFGFSEELVIKKQDLYLQIGKPQKAIQEVERLTKENPRNLGYQTMLAQLYERTNNPQQAELVYKKILTQDPSNAEANFALAETYRKKGEHIKFLLAIKEMFKNPTLSIDTKIKQLLPYAQQFAKADTKPDLELVKTAVSLAEILVEIHPKEAKAHSILADIAFNGLGDSKRALAELTETKRLDSSVFPVWEQIMYLHAEAGDYAALEEVTNEAIELFPNKAKSFYFNGIAQTELEKPQKAAIAFEQCLLMVGKNLPLKLDVYARLGSAYASLKQFAKAEEAFEAGLKLDGNAPVVLASYGTFLAERGTNIEKAKQLTKKALDISPNVPNYMEAYGWSFYKDKDYKSAKEWLFKALQNTTEPSAILLERCGDVLLQLGQREEAVAFWQKALQKGGSAARLNQKISILKL